MRNQAVNDAGAMLFFLVILATAILAIATLVRKLRRRSIRRIGLTIAACWIFYIAILFVVSLTSATRQIPLRAEKCFDDWCATVTGARAFLEPTPTAGGKFIVVSLRVSNHARQAAFRPSQPRLTLQLPSGGSVSPSTAGQGEFEKQAGPQENLAKRIIAGESFETSVVFEVPTAAHQAVVLLEGPPQLTKILVGDENSLFHKKVVFPITID
jgi:hypothetical protein